MLPVFARAMGPGQSIVDLAEAVESFVRLRDCRNISTIEVLCIT